MDPKSKAKMRRLFQGPYGWINLIMFFVAWYAVFEFGLTLFQMDLAAMIWTPLHFAITPLLGFIVSIVSVYKTIKRRKVLPIAASICSALVIISISYIGMSGSAIILDALGISFN